MSFTEDQEKIIRMLCRNAVRIGFDEGIEAAAEMIREAHKSGFTASLLELADLIESSVDSPCSSDHI